MDSQPAASAPTFAAPAALVQPRYRRLLTFGDILDESVRLYREHFVAFALVSAIALFPAGLIEVGLSAAGLTTPTFTAADFQPGGRFNTATADFTPIMRLGSATLGLALVAAVFGALWTAVVVLLTDAYVRGEDLPRARLFGRGASRWLALLLASLVVLVGLVVLTCVGAALFVVTALGLVGGPMAVVALLFWWLRPTSRRGWLKWLIILTTPFGLPTYFAFRWSMSLAAIVLEGRGPLGGIGRSAELVAGEWFRVSAILTVAPLIVGVLISAISALVNLPISLAAASRGPFGADPTMTAISIAVSTVLQILFGSVAAIVYALLFHDLRNRREGTDLVERVRLLESAAGG